MSAWTITHVKQISTMAEDYQEKFERMGVAQVKAALATMRRDEKIAAKHWLERNGIKIAYDEQADTLREQRIAGAEAIVQIVRDIAVQRGISLHEANVLPDPTKESENHSSETYTLVVTASQKIAQEIFPRSDLENMPESTDIQHRVRTTLESVLERLEFEQLL